MRELVPNKITQIFLQYLLVGLKSKRKTAHVLNKACEQLQGLEIYFPYTPWLPLSIAHPLWEIEHAYQGEY